MWIYEGEEFTSEMIGEWHSFVYLIHCKPTGQMYVGKKVFKNKKTLPPLKGKKRKRVKWTESDWQSYWSSSKYVHDLVEKYGEEEFVREIISLHPDKREANYHELMYQIVHNVLEKRDSSGQRVYLNENIDRIYYPSKNHGESRTNLLNKYIEDLYGHIHNIQIDKQSQ